MPLTFRAETTIQIGNHSRTGHTTNSCRETWVDNLRDLVKGLPSKVNREKAGNRFASIPYNSDILDIGNQAIAYLWTKRVFPQGDPNVKTKVKLNAHVSDAVFQHWLKEIQPHYPDITITYVQKRRDQSAMEEDVWSFFDDRSLESAGAGANAEIICEGQGWEAISAAWWLILFNRIVSCGVSEDRVLSKTIKELMDDSQGMSNVWYSSSDREAHVACWNRGRFAPFCDWVAQWGIVGASMDKRDCDFEDLQRIIDEVEDVERYRKILLD